MSKNICTSCKHYKYCDYPCAPVDQYANGNIPQREQPITPEILSERNNQDYNHVLYELIENKRNSDIDRLEIIRHIPDYRLRAIAACTLAHIPQGQIAKLAHISQGRISKLYRGIRR
jgi:hypothetical protein